MTRVIGLTGGIASGKSTVARLLRELGAPVVDADELARRVVLPGEPAYLDIVQEFGPSVVATDGTLDRKRLADVVFSDADKRKRLQAITHPRIAQLGQAETAAYAARGAPIVVYEAALLVENGLHKVLGGTIVVSATPEQQLARAVARDGMTEEAARARIASQLPLGDKLAVATHVIDNSGPPGETRRQVEALWRELNAEASP
jgi:dephospho-CoA kinase